MDEPTLSEKLARHHAALRLNQVPAAVVEAAKLHILDSLGCLLAGCRLETGKLAYNLAVATSRESGPSATATLFGTNARVSYLDAVQAMSAAAHCGEMDDIHGGAGTCIGAMVVPALLASAERFGGSGHNFLEGAIAGYETIARVGLAIDAPALFARGWWPSTICGALGVAAAGAKLLGWPAEKTANALGIAVLQTGGMITGGNEGATARHLAFGRAAQNGILALLAADRGFTGPKRAFEDPRGFCLTLCGEPRWELLRDVERYHLPDVAFKPYPCARQLHAGVEALLTLIRQHSITMSSIQEIELSVPTPNAAMLNRPAAPAGHAAAVGSGQYVMAVTALRGRIDLASFEEEFLRSDSVRELMKKVTVKGDASLDRHFPKHWPGLVRVNLMDGRVYAQEVIIPKGEAGNPMAPEELEEKFLSSAAPVLGDAKARAVIGEVQSLANRESLGPLISVLQLP
ncbi:MAG: MmgE/PrpD family protein [Deltaproteobacteria bacterium]|nr:MmgE/PrpD family protein [Deltaproteobacteria bacterium]MDZ4342465.1 MmgE/PrpD family protein [Candidatus Binatia bacterium]